MALIVPGSLVSDVRGSIGTETYSRNQGGLYVRTRAGPIGAPTAKQLNRQAAMTALSQAWSGTLNEAQRDTWRQYAHAFPGRNRWGNPTQTNGYCRFVAVNYLNYIRDTAIITNTAPTAPPLNPPLFSFDAFEEESEVTVNLPLDLELPDDSQFRAYLFAGLSINAGVSFYLHPFTSISTNLKTNAVWGLDPWTSATDDALIGDKKVYLRMRIQNTITFAVSPPSFASALILPEP